MNKSEIISELSKLTWLRKSMAKITKVDNFGNLHVKIYNYLMEDIDQELVFTIDYHNFPLQIHINEIPSKTVYLIVANIHQLIYLCEQFNITMNFTPQIEITYEVYFQFKRYKEDLERRNRGK